MRELSDSLSFVRNGRSSTVHVVAPPDTPWPSAVGTEYATMGPAWALVTIPVLTLCGWIARTSPAFDDHYVEAFPDDSLCHACHKALGDQAHLAFEHEQFEPEV